jgi:hypothetical protein
MSTMNRSSQFVIYDDAVSSNNPQRRAVDWRRVLSSIPVFNPRTHTVHIDPLAEVTIFDGSRTLGSDNTTEYALTSSLIDPASRYRLAWTSVGTAPQFRTERVMSLIGGSITLVLNSNSTMTATHSAGAVFGAVQVSDIVFIPGITTGDPSLFDSMNEGEWVVLSATSTTLVLTRKTGEIFSAASDIKAITTISQFQAYSASGVQVGDTLDLSSGFAASSRQSYKIVAVTSRLVEFTSTQPLALQTVTPGSSSVKVYSSSKRYVYIETDQALALKYNGATDETSRLEPIIGGDPSFVGISEKWGTAYSLVLKNRSSARASVTVITAE